MLVLSVPEMKRRIQFCETRDFFFINHDVLFCNFIEDSENKVFLHPIGTHEGLMEQKFRAFENYIIVSPDK